MSKKVDWKKKYYELHDELKKKQATIRQKEDERSRISTFLSGLYELTQKKAELNHCCSCLLQDLQKLHMFCHLSDYELAFYTNEIERLR